MSPDINGYQHELEVVFVQMEQFWIPLDYSQWIAEYHSGSYYWKKIGELHVKENLKMFIL